MPISLYLYCTPIHALCIHMCLNMCFIPHLHFVPAHDWHDLHTYTCSMYLGTKVLPKHRKFSGCGLGCSFGCRSSLMVYSSGSAKFTIQPHHLGKYIWTHICFFWFQQRTHFLEIAMSAKAILLHLGWFWSGQSVWEYDLLQKSHDKHACRAHSDNTVA